MKIVVLVRDANEVPDTVAKSNDVEIVFSGFGNLQVRKFLYNFLTDQNDDTFFLCLGYCSSVNPNFTVGQVIFPSKLITDQYFPVPPFQVVDDPECVKTVNGIMGCESGIMQTVNMPSFCRSQINSSTCCVDREMYHFAEMLQNRFFFVIAQIVGEIIPAKALIYDLRQNINYGELKPRLNFLANILITNIKLRY